MRTIKNFCFGDFKKRRHAARLAINLVELLKTGRFEPKLNEHSFLYVQNMAILYFDQKLYETLKKDLNL